MDATSFPDVLTAEQVAGFLALPAQAIADLVSEHRIPHAVLDGVLRSSRRQVLDWLASLAARQDELTRP